MDEIRGLCVLLMIFYHAFYTMSMLFHWELGTKLLVFFSPAEPFFAGLFILISGISSQLSHSNLIRGLKLLGVALALTLVTNIIVQVLKSLLYDMLPTNLLAFLVAAVVTVGAGFGLWSYYRFAITGWMIVALIALIFLVAFSAMFGYDKLVQLMEQAGWIKAQK